MYCEEQSSQKRSLATPFRMKSVNARDLKQNITGGSGCGKPNCFCCCEDLVCPLQQSGSTESCVERSKDIDMYCNEIETCQQDLTSKEKLKMLGMIIDTTEITQIRQKFYNHQTKKNPNFQFAVFKFGPSNSYWDPPINDLGLDWTSSLVVQNISQNTWQASSYSCCEDGCHTESAIINDSSETGLVYMFDHECDQVDLPHVLNIYSWNSPCITGPGCQYLIQQTLEYRFNNKYYSKCNKEKWEINIVWTLQFRDQKSEDCLAAWGDWAAEIEESHPTVTVKFGRQSIGKLSVGTDQFVANTVNSNSFVIFLIKIGGTFICCILTLLFCCKFLSNA